MIIVLKNYNCYTFLRSLYHAELNKKRVKNFMDITYIEKTCIELDETYIDATYIDQDLRQRVEVKGCWPNISLIALCPFF